MRPPSGCAKESGQGTSTPRSPRAMRHRSRNAAKACSGRGSARAAGLPLPPEPTWAGRQRRLSDAGATGRAPGGPPTGRTGDLPHLHRSHAEDLDGALRIGTGRGRLLNGNRLRRGDQPLEGVGRLVTSEHGPRRSLDLGTLLGNRDSRVSRVRWATPDRQLLTVDCVRANDTPGCPLVLNDPAWASVAKGKPD